MISGFEKSARHHPGRCFIIGMTSSSGVPVYSSRGSGPRLEEKNPANDQLLQFELSIRRETYVCFQRKLTVASRHCVQPKINGPLHCTTLIRSEDEEEKAGEIPGNELVVDPANKRRCAPVHREITVSSLFKSGLTDENSGEGEEPSKSIGTACV